MQVIDQTLDDVVASLSPLAVEWMDDTAANAIAKLTALPSKEAYGREDIAQLLSGDFDEGLLCCRLFLALSKDTMESELRGALGAAGIGIKRYQADPDAFIAALEQLGLPDGGVVNSEAQRMIVIAAIRKYQPDIVLANAVHDRHPDHAASAQLVADACFLSGLQKIHTMGDNSRAQQAWRPKAVYHYIQDYLIEPDFVIDITAEMDAKMQAILAFTSQFVEPNDKQPGSILGLLNQIKSTNSIFGRPINVAYAEGFTATRYIGVQNLYDLQ